MTVLGLGFLQALPVEPQTFEKWVTGRVLQLRDRKTSGVRTERARAGAGAESGAEPDAHASGALCWGNVARPSRVHCGASKGPVRFPGVLLRGGGAVAPEIEDLLRRQR